MSKIFNSMFYSNVYILNFMQGGNQAWRYDVERTWLVHGGNPRCLDMEPGSGRLFVTK